jgi:hypothetical protein
MLDRALAGAISSLAIQLAHPIDLMKIRMQVADPKGHTNVPNFAKYSDLALHIYRNEGLRAFYKGASFSIIPNFLITGYFVTNPLFKKLLNHIPFFREYPNIKIIASNIFLSAGVAFLVTPFYVLKTRKLTDTNRFEQSKSIRELHHEIKSTMGNKGFLRGTSMTFIIGLNGGVTTAAIDLLKSNLAFENHQSLWLFLIGGTAKTITSSVFYPASTIRARMEQNQIFGGLSGYKYNGIVDCAIKTYGAEGWRGFYRGFLANAVRGFMTTGSIMFVYTAVYNQILRMRHSRSSPDKLF